MNAVGIDVSKGKSMMAALRPMGEVALPPKEYSHTEVGLERMALDILALGEDTRALMEATGRYHEPVAAALHEYGIRVTVLNPLFIKQSGGGSIRKVKTDKADAVKIAKYALDNWVDLREYTPMEAVRELGTDPVRPFFTSDQAAPMALITLLDLGAVASRIAAWARGSWASGSPSCMAVSTQDFTMETAWG